MNKTIHIWLLKGIIKLCDFCLRFKEGASSQEEVNEVIKTKNDLLTELELISKL